MSDADAYLETALELIQDTSEIALRHFRTTMSVDDKSDGDHFDPVTQADVEIEEQLRAELSARYPDHGIIGEEQADRRANSEFEWIIDPIDGTRAFITGMPAWGILLGLTEDGAPRAGVMHQPYIGETFYGAPGIGARLRHRGTEVSLATRTGVALADAALYCTHPDMFFADGERAAFDRVARACRMTRFGGDCYSYCLLALGQADLVVESSMQPYDIVPLIPIIEAAGGIVTDGRGGSAAQGGFVVAAGSAALHAQALAAIAL